MNVLDRPSMTVEQFLAWEEQQEERWEFDGFRPVAMTGGTKAHAQIQVGLLTALVTRLRGGQCRVYGSHLKLKTARAVRYPDAFVSCAPFDGKANVETEPVVIFEVLSPSTLAEDLVHKSFEYRATPSVQRYVVLEQTQVAATVFSRRGDLWITDTLAGADAILDMPEIGVCLALGEIYADIIAAEASSGA